MPASVEGLSGSASATVSESPRFVRRLARRPLAIGCLVYLAAVVCIAIIAPLLMSSVAHEQAGDLLNVDQGPTWDHLLGTDSLGRDVLDRLLVGSQVAMIGVSEGLIVVLALGVPLGLAAGFFGGRLDRIVAWLADLTFSMPAV